MPKYFLTLLCAAVLLLGGCNVVYKQNIQQGNALEQEDLDQLELGMSKNQVAFLLGTPAIKDPFHHDRWDYVSSFSRRGGEPVRRLVTLTFDNGNLSGMTGVREGEAEEVLTDSGAESVTAAAPVVGTEVDRARAFGDLPVAEAAEQWSVQFGSYSNRNAAEARVKVVNEAGFEARLYGQVISNSAFFIVRGDDYTDKAAALAALRAAEAKGIRGFLVSPGS